ncbi:MAG: amino acid-binding protein [Lachnospiraceae bacterium]|nr:amino acid-binding protein [Lachnospiraceae bacterium]MBP5564630.1 amino acid-binding protein [Lachnospiraceae bacterium]
MYLKQLTVFLENREGRLDSVTDILAKNDINIVCLTLADTSEYGVIRMIVSDPDKAKSVLKAEGCLARLTDVLAVEMEQKAGSLNKITKIFSDENINIEYMYTLNSAKEAGSMILKCSDIEKGFEVVKKAGFKLVDPNIAYAI